jgi:hypothetical protein
VSDKFQFNQIQIYPHLHTPPVRLSVGIPHLLSPPPPPHTRRNCLYIENLVGWTRITQFTLRHRTTLSKTNGIMTPLGSATTSVNEMSTLVTYGTPAICVKILIRSRLGYWKILETADSFRISWLSYGISLRLHQFYKTTRETLYHRVTLCSPKTLKNLLLPPQGTSRLPLDVFLRQTFGYMVGTVFLFGYGQTVMYFTKICLLILGSLWTTQIKVTNMSDDWVVFEKTEEISNVPHLVTSVLTSFGCHLFLGFLIDIQKYEFRSSIDKIECTRDTIKMM